MKKLIFIALAVFMFSSCVRDNFITETFFPDSFTEVYRVYRRDWRRGNDAVHGVHFFYEFTERALTSDVWRYGAMQAFLIYNRAGRERISPLPFSDFFVDNNGVRWEEHLTVEFSPQTITFIMKNNDQIHERPFFDYYEFMVRFVW